MQFSRLNIFFTKKLSFFTKNPLFTMKRPFWQWSVLFPLKKNLFQYKVPHFQKDHLVNNLKKILCFWFKIWQNTFWMVLNKATNCVFFLLFLLEIENLVFSKIIISGKTFSFNARRSNILEDNQKHLKYWVNHLLKISCRTE